MFTLTWTKCLKKSGKRSNFVLEKSGKPQSDLCTNPVRLTSSCVVSVSLISFQLVLLGCWVNLVFSGVLSRWLFVVLEVLVPCIFRFTLTVYKEVATNIKCEIFTHYL